MRILGIDLGSTSIKAVEIDSAFGRYEIHDYYEHPVEPGVDLNVAILRLMQALPKQPDRIGIALRTGQSTFRNLRLPTRDRKSIQAGVGFELDDELPFPLERAIYDYSVVSQSKHGTQVHVASTLKSHVAAAIDFWLSGGVNADLITTESWAYRTLFSRMLGRAEQEKPVLLIQIGGERTTLYVHWNGAPVLAREIAWGGRDLTKAIAQKYGLSLDQAEQAKLDHGFVVPSEQRNDVTFEQQEFSDTLIASIQPLFVEIRQVELTCKSVTHESPHLAFVAGGSMLLPGLVRVIEEAIRIPMRPLQALSSIATSGVTYSEHTDAVFPLAAAVALCLVGSDRSSAINFRRGEFSKAGQQREILSVETLKRPALSLATIAICMVTSLSVQSMAYNSKLTDLDARIERSTRSFFGAISSSAIRTYLSNPETLRNTINKALQKQRNLAMLASPNPKSPLEFLSQLSSSVPRDVVTDLMQYQEGAAPSSSYQPDGPRSASLSFEVANQQVADRLASVLGGKIAGMRKEKAEEVTAPDGRKRLRVTFVGKPNF